MHINELIRAGAIETMRSQLTEQPQLANQPDDRGFTPLIFATYLDNMIAAKLLLDHGADINAKVASGNTALMGVTFKGNEMLVKFLIERGADVNIQNDNGATALNFAIDFGHLEIFKLLLKAGADLNIKDKDGKTALEHIRTQQKTDMEALIV